MTVWLWDVEGPERSASGVSDDEGRALQLAEESLYQVGADEALVERAYAVLEPAMLAYGYHRTGDGWHARRTPDGITWERFAATDLAACMPPGALPRARRSSGDLFNVLQSQDMPGGPARPMVACLIGPVAQYEWRASCILSGMEDLFDFQALWIQQPGKLLANRAKYEIFNAERQLLAVATASENHARLGLISKAMPNTTALAVTKPAGELILSLAMRHNDWTTDVHGPASELLGRIRTGGSRRHYTLLDDQDEAVGTVVGDLGLKKFSVAGNEGARFGQVRKTWAGLRKEMLTSSDHYKVEFTGPASRLVRVLTVMMPIVLDLTLYEPI